MPKNNRNDPCPCGSEKKYKNCCLELDMMKKQKYEYGQQTHTERVASIIERLAESIQQAPFIRTPKKIIDITDDLDEITYRDYQVKNYTNDTIMIAEKTSKSERVFLTRVDSATNDFIIMYKGSYRTFEYSRFPLLLNNLLNYING
jgi:hypothetical protein